MMLMMIRHAIVAPLIELLPDAPGANTGLVAFGAKETAGLGAVAAVCLGDCEALPDAGFEVATTAALTEVFFFG